MELNSDYAVDMTKYSNYIAGDTVLLGWPYQLWWSYTAEVHL